MSMKTAFMEMYVCTGGKPVSWGMSAAELTIDHVPLP